MFTYIVGTGAPLRQVNRSHRCEIGIKYGIHQFSPPHGFLQGNLHDDPQIGTHKVNLCQLIFRWLIISNILLARQKFFLISNLVVANLITCSFSVCNPSWRNGWPRPSLVKWLMRPDCFLPSIFLSIKTRSIGPDGNISLTSIRANFLWSSRPFQKVQEYLSRMSFSLLRIPIQRFPGWSITSRLSWCNAGILWLYAPIPMNKKGSWNDAMVCL